MQFHFQQMSQIFLYEQEKENYQSWQTKCDWTFRQHSNSHRNIARVVVMRFIVRVAEIKIYQRYGNGAKQRHIGYYRV